MGFSNYPHGFPNGVSILGMPVLNTYTGSVYYVSSTKGLDGNQGTFNSPFKTLQYAVNRCKANNGDIIILMPSHVETITTSGGISISTAGISIVGLGVGASRPTFIFSTSVQASMSISSKNVYMKNIVGVAGIDGLVNPFVVTGNDFYFDGEWQDLQSNIEAIRAFSVDSVNRVKIILKYSGMFNGSSCESAVTIKGSNRVEIYCDFFGKASTAWVNMVSAVSNDIQVYGYMYNSGTTDFTKDVVDTVTGSTWFAQLNDGSAGKIIYGGSGGALAALT